MEQLRQLVTPRTRLISLVHVSNMLGCTLPVHSVAELAQGVGAKLLLDCCQSGGCASQSDKGLGLGRCWAVWQASGGAVAGREGGKVLWCHQPPSMPPPCLSLAALPAVPNMPVDVSTLGADWIVASAHKMCGPTGIGFLWGR